MTRVTIPATLARRRSASRVAARSAAPAGATRSDAAVAEAAFRSSGPDTLLPGAPPRADNLLPRPRRRRPRALVEALARKERRYLLVIVVAGVALTIGLLAVWPVVFKSDTPPAASSTVQQEHARATSLLRTVVGGARTLFAPRRSFTQVSPSALRARSRNIPIVASATKARAGVVSMRVTSAAVLTLATPADAQRCVFARDEPGRAGTQFVTVRTADCRAAAAPAKGWSSR
ncbi:MAG: hypothetical protein M3Q30_04800 [Actinomycetota bacterium]|nr:hypothetical protein [Actinomycetota bacterium]